MTEILQPDAVPRPARQPGDISFRNTLGRTGTTQGADVPPGKRDAALENVSANMTGQRRYAAINSQFLVRFRFGDVQEAPSTPPRATGGRLSSSQLAPCVNRQDRHFSSFSFEPCIVQHVGNDTNVIWDNVHLRSDFKPVIWTASDDPMFLAQFGNSRLLMSDEIPEAIEPKQIRRQNLGPCVDDCPGFGGDAYDRGNDPASAVLPVAGFPLH